MVRTKGSVSVFVPGTCVSRVHVTLILCCAWNLTFRNVSVELPFPRIIPHFEAENVNTNGMNKQVISRIMSGWHTSTSFLYLVVRKAEDSEKESRIRNDYRTSFIPFDGVQSVAFQFVGARQFDRVSHIRRGGNVQHEYPEGLSRQFCADPGQKGTTDESVETKVQCGRAAHSSSRQYSE